MKRLRNSSGVPDTTVKNVVSWIAAELGIDQFDRRSPQLLRGLGRLCLHQRR
jgi:hypothetical protein